MKIQEYNITRGSNSENYNEYMKKLKKMRMEVMTFRMIDTYKENGTFMTRELDGNNRSEEEKEKLSNKLNDLFDLMSTILSEDEIPQSLRNLYDKIYKDIDMSDFILD